MMNMTLKRTAGAGALLAQAAGAGQDLLRGLSADHDLEQLHDRHRVEEVQPQEALRPREGGGDLVDRQARGIAGQDRARRLLEVDPELSW